MKSRLFNTKKGITPVIAIVLLVMMAVGIAGGAFIWITRFSEQAQQKTTEQMGKELSVKTVECLDVSGSEDVVRLVVSNGGNKQIDMVPANLFIYDTATGNIDSTLSVQNVNSSANPAFENAAFVNPGEFGTVYLKTGGNFSSGTMYDIEVEFPQDSYEGLRADCRAE